MGDILNAGLVEVEMWTEGVSGLYDTYMGYLNDVLLTRREHKDTARHFWWCSIVSMQIYRKRGASRVP